MSYWYFNLKLFEFNYIIVMSKIERKMKIAATKTNNVHENLFFIFFLLSHTRKRDSHFSLLNQP